MTPGLCSHEPSISRLFDDTAASTPDSTALQNGVQRVTYGALLDSANRFCLFLRRQGVLPGDFVAVLAGRSVPTIIALLGILKAGAAYVPLDPGDPPERLRRLLADCAPVLVLAEDEATRLAVMPAMPTLVLGEALAASLDEIGQSPSHESGPDDVACIMYTSGSTGQPKGVVVPHRGVARLVRRQDYAPFGPSETVLHLAPLAFDASTFEIWGALLNGARLAVVTAARPSLDDIAHAIERHRVTVAWFTAGLFALLVDHRIDALAPLRCIVAGGDVLSPAHVQRAYAQLPECRIVNGYGPTENTTFTTCFAIPRDGWGGGPLPVGTPIRGTEVHILDADLAPVPPGDIGQICCSGDGLALCYLNQHRLTAAAFVDVDLDGTRRIYLTGDLGRMRPDGALEFLGRRDSQVKISGKRIELGDIENTLRFDPEIDDAVVVARDGPSGAKRLIAYIKPHGSWPSSGAARQADAALARLRQKLPDYMVPSAAVVLSEFPLTVNGKVDRARLPAPAGPMPPRRVGRSAASATEDAVAAIWQSVLGVESVDRETNFFDIGGSSLLLMAVHQRLQASGLSLPIVTLFERTTVRGIAAALDGSSGPSTSHRRIPSLPPVAVAALSEGTLS